MSFDLGMKCLVILVGIIVVLIAIFLIATYKQKKHHYNYLKYRGRVRDIRAEQAYADIEAAIWDSCRLNANYIVKELSRK